MPDPVVSIVVNNYNYGRFLAAAIDSALAQDYEAVEVIVVDDGSTDGSREVVARYGKRIRAVFKDNGGQGSAFNAGFVVSHGRIVNFLDADDTLHPDAARRAAQVFDDPSVSQWLAPLEMIDAAGNRMGRIFPDRPLPAGDLRARTLAYGPWAYQVVPTSGNFWARWYLERVLPIPAQFTVGGDEFLCSVAALYGRLASDSRPVGCYRGHGGNVYWRRRIGIDDVAADSFYFQRISGLIEDHAGRLGLAVVPQAWNRRDWRQQVRRVVLHRAGRSAEPPMPAHVLGAVWDDQTRPYKKAVLLPMVATMLALPAKQSIAFGLKLLTRR